MKIGFLCLAVTLLLGGRPASAGTFSQLKGPEEQLALLSEKAGLSIPADATPLEMLRIVFAANQGKALPAGLKARYVGDAFLNDDSPLPADTLPFPQGGANTMLVLEPGQNGLITTGGDLTVEQLPKDVIRRELKSGWGSYGAAANTAAGTTMTSFDKNPVRTLELRQAGPFVVGVSRRDDLDPQWGGVETYFLFYKRIDQWALFPAVLSRAQDSAKALQK